MTAAVAATAAAAAAHGLLHSKTRLWHSDKDILVIKYNQNPNKCTPTYTHTDTLFQLFSLFFGRLFLFSFNNLLKERKKIASVGKFEFECVGGGVWCRLVVDIELKRPLRDDDAMYDDKCIGQARCVGGGGGQTTKRGTRHE